MNLKREEIEMGARKIIDRKTEKCQYCGQPHNFVAYSLKENGHPLWYYGKMGKEEERIHQKVFQGA